MIKEDHRRSSQRIINDQHRRSSEIISEVSLFVSFTLLSCSYQLIQHNSVNINVQKGQEEEGQEEEEEEEEGQEE